MKKIAVLLMIITITSKFIGFGREIILSFFYGASVTSDIYIIARIIPTVIFAFIGTGISTGYIPIYSKMEKTLGVRQANNFTNNLVNLLMIICTAMIILGLIFTQQIVRVFASGFSGEILTQAVFFTRISFLGMYFTALINVFIPFLQIKDNYVIPALIGFPMNFFIILTIILSYRENTTILAAGIVLSVMAQFFLLLPFIIKKGFQYKININLKDPHIKNMAYLAIPVFWGVAVNDLNIIIDKTLASRIATGGISALNYAYRLNTFVQGIFVISIVTVMFPMISKMVVEDNIKGLKKSVSEAIGSITLFVLPGSIGAIVFAKPIVTLLFGRGAFDIEAITMTSQALLFYSIGMIGFGLREVLSRVFYSLQDTKTPMINTTIAVALNVLLNILLSRYLGIGGLALATSISTLFCTGLLFISLRKKMGSIGMKKITINFLKVLIASVIMGGIAKLSFDYLRSILNQNLSLIISIGIGIIIYFIIIYFMKIDDADTVIKAIKEKIRKKTSNVETEIP